MQDKDNLSFLKLANRIGHGLYVALGLLFLFAVVAVLIFIILYIIKSLLGINIFPGGHFWEVLF